jgi:hypothetical protein
MSALRFFPTLLSGVEENGFRRVSPRLCGSGVVSIDQVDARVLRVGRAFRRSRHAIAAARDDLENHQLWLNRHRAAWAEHKTLRAQAG